MSNSGHKEEKFSRSALCRNPVFFIQTFLWLLLTAVLITAEAGKFWPPFATSHRGFFFVNKGITSSFLVLEISSLASWIVFEHCNWVHYVLTYVLCGSLMMVTGFIFLSDYSGRKTDIWPCDKWECEIRGQELVIEIFLIIVASGYILLSFVILIARERAFRIRKISVKGN